MKHPSKRPRTPSAFAIACTALLCAGCAMEAAESGDLAEEQEVVGESAEAWLPSNPADKRMTPRTVGMPTPETLTNGGGDNKPTPDPWRTQLGPIGAAPGGETGEEGSGNGAEQDEEEQANEHEHTAEPGANQTGPGVQIRE